MIIDDVIAEIEQEKDYVFEYNRNKINLYERLEKLGFIAEIDHSIVYLFMINNLKNQETGEVYIPTDDELEVAYVNKKLPPVLADLSLNSCSCWKFEMGMTDPTVMYIVTDNGVLSRSPKQNFAEAFEKYENRYAYLSKKHHPENKDRISLFFAYKENKALWKKLKLIFEKSKERELVQFPNFTRKVYYDISRYWGDPLELQEEQNRMTEQYDIWPIPTHKFKYVGLDRDTEFVIGKRVGLPAAPSIEVTIGGVDYDSLKFDHPQGLTRTFSNGRDFRNYLCTIIQYIAAHFGADIKNLYRQYFNNQWPIGEKRDNQWILKICKFKGMFIIECEVWEHGLVYKLTNFKIYSGSQQADPILKWYDYDKAPVMPTPEWPHGKPASIVDFIELTQRDDPQNPMFKFIDVTIHEWPTINPNGLYKIYHNTVNDFSRALFLAQLPFVTGDQVYEDLLTHFQTGEYIYYWVEAIDDQGILQNVSKSNIRIS